MSLTLYRARNEYLAHLDLGEFDEVLDIGTEYGGTPYAVYLKQHLPEGRHLLTPKQTALLYRAAFPGQNPWDLLKGTKREAEAAYPNFVTKMADRGITPWNFAWEEVEMPKSALFLSGHYLDDGFWSREVDGVLIGDPLLQWNPGLGHKKLMARKSSIIAGTQLRPYLERTTPGYVDEYRVGDPTVVEQRLTLELADRDTELVYICFKYAQVENLPAFVDKPFFLSEETPDVLQTLADIVEHGANPVYRAIIRIANCARFTDDAERLIHTGSDTELERLKDATLGDLLDIPELTDVPLLTWAASPQTFTHPGKSAIRAVMVARQKEVPEIMVNPEFSWRSRDLYRAYMTGTKEVLIHKE